MRHIKYFKESNNIISKLKKYVITYHNNSYFIDQLINFNKNDISKNLVNIINIYYTEENGTDIKKNDFKGDTITYKYFNDFFIFSSDSLEECVKYLEILLTAKKYNL